MNRAQLEAAAALGCRIQIWHLRPGATSSADGQWDDADPTVKPTFECPEHLYRVHPDDLHLLRADNERRARELLAAEFERGNLGIDRLAARILRDPDGEPTDDEHIAIRAIVAALEEVPAGSVGGEAECMGWVFQHEDTGRMTFCPNDGVNNPSIFVEINTGYALCGPAYTRPAPAVVDGNAVADQLRRELADDKGWDYTEYEKGRIAEKERCISLLASSPTTPAAALAQPQGNEVTRMDALMAAFNTWPADIRKKLSLHDLRRMTGWAPQPQGREAQATDTDLLDFMARHRASAIPEFEGPWDVCVYDESAGEVATGSDADLRAAIRNAMSEHAKGDGDA